MLIIPPYHSPRPCSPQDLKDKKWTKKKWNGPLQYEDPTGKLMMLPTDMVLLWDRGFKK